MSETHQANTMVCNIHGTDFIEIENYLYNDINSNSFGVSKTTWVCKQCNDEFEKMMQIREEEENKRRIEAEKRSEWEKKYSGIPKIYHGVEYSDIEQHKVLTDFVESGKGFLFIHGCCGSGKTHAMCAIKKKMNIESKQCLLFTASKIFLDIRKSFNDKDSTEESIIRSCAPEVKDPYRYRDHFAIFDDIGAQKISEYVIEVWYNIINERYINGYTTIFTSNLSLKEIAAIMSDRVASRLASGIIYEMKGPDRRLIKQ